MWVYVMNPWQTLYASGMRKIVLFGEGVDGCEPIVRIQNNSQCVDFFNELALESLRQV
jgi:hypothetical protein